MLDRIDDLSVDVCARTRVCRLRVDDVCTTSSAPRSQPIYKANAESLGLGFFFCCPMGVEDDEEGVVGEEACCCWPEAEAAGGPEPDPEDFKEALECHEVKFWR